MAYGVLALLTTLVAASYEGLFITERVVVWNNEEYLVRPLIRNFSTLLDFGVLNPLVILYLLSARSKMSIVGLPQAVSTRGRRALSVTVSLLLLSVAGTITWLHFREFLAGDYFDAVVAISETGERLVTVSGWVVFFWTTLFIYFVLSGALEQLRYSKRVLELTSEDIPYEIYHEDNSAGVRVYAEPALLFLKAMFFLLLIYVVFAIYDLVFFEAQESRRLWTLVVYLVVVAPLFLVPVAHLHRLMKRRQASLLRTLLRRRFDDVSKLITGAAERRPNGSYGGLADELQALDGVRGRILDQPVWPFPVSTLIGAGAYLLTVASPLLPRALSLLLSAVGVSWPGD